MMAPKAVLVGLPGSGKSTIGRRLAQALDLPLLDTDVEVVERPGRRIAEIFVQEGEPEFRASRKRSSGRPSRATRGSCRSAAALTSPSVREALAGHTVIYLEISVAEGFGARGHTARPLLAGGDPREKYRS